jgi:hypothetical protein
MPSGYKVDIPEQLLLSPHENNLGDSVKNFNYTSDSALVGHTVEIVDMDRIETNFADRLVPYDNARLVSILRALYAGANLEPVVVSRTYRAPPFKLENGFHRFIGSVVMGFTRIPCLVPNVAQAVASGGPKYIPPHLRNR